jgi:hypothetical protein
VTTTAVDPSRVWWLDTATGRFTHCHTEGSPGARGSSAKPGQIPTRHRHRARRRFAESEARARSGSRRGPGPRSAQAAVGVSSLPVLGVEGGCGALDGGVEGDRVWSGNSYGQNCGNSCSMQAGAKRIGFH